MGFVSNTVSTALGVTIGGLVIIKVVTSKQAVDEMSKILGDKLQEEIKKGIKIVFNSSDD